MAHSITSKAALVGLTQALARELGNDGITVNAILPGSTETEANTTNEITKQNRQNYVCAASGDSPRRRSRGLGPSGVIPGLESGWFHPRPKPAGQRWDRVRVI